MKTDLQPPKPLHCGPSVGYDGSKPEQGGDVTKKETCHRVSSVQVPLKLWVRAKQHLIDAEKKHGPDFASVVGYKNPTTLMVKALDEYLSKHKK